MAKNEKTSKTVASVAAAGIKHPEKLSKREIQQVCASALNQTPDKPKPKK